MSMLNRFFSKKPAPFANQVLDILKRASEAAKKPRGLGQSAIDGAQTRHHLISLIEKVEAQIGQPKHSPPHVHNQSLIGNKFTTPFGLCPLSTSVDSGVWGAAHHQAL
jgi:hypothetical protein